MKYKKIGDVCTILSGYAFDSKQFSNDPRDFPLIRIRDIVRGRTETYTKEKFDEKYIVKKGEFLIGMDGEFNIAPWNSQEALLNQRVCKIWCSSDEVIDNYLLYFLPKALKDIESKTSFVTVKHLSVKGINQIGIPLPPLEIQQRIAATLDTAAALLKLRQQQLAELEALIQSVFYEMFGDPVRNEKGWEIKPINEFSTVKIGPFGSLLHVSDYIENGYPLVNPAHINNGNIEPDLKLTLTDDKFAELEKYTMKKNDIVVGRRGEIGRCAVVEKEGYLCGTGSMFIRVKHDYLPLVLQRILSSKSIRKKLLNQSVGVTMKNLNSSTISNLEVPMIPLSLQTQFAAIVQKIEQQKALVQQSIDETQTLFDSLMSQYFE